ncbi:MAG: hypothetical protein JNL32_02295 [Candidatus Kapabacteria bacterium]|nr:hypothetical protein [Candidatus Kapabacteria bacterium]
MDSQPLQPVRAFVSCSLRTEDEMYVSHIESIVRSFGIEPFGTVGRFSAAPVNPTILMRENIDLADVVVVVATPRYSQVDVRTKIQNYGVSEMIHVESGMAYAKNKPIIVFVRTGTNVGNFLPNVTQYVELDGSIEMAKRKWNLIKSLFQYAISVVNYNRRIVDERNSQMNRDSFAKLLLGGAIGAATVAVLFNGENETDDKKKRTKKRK